MSAILFFVTVFVAGYGLRIAYGLANSLNSGCVSGCRARKSS
jgi:hypothetical protein